MSRGIKHNEIAPWRMSGWPGAGLRRRRAFVLFMALGVLAVVWLLALAATSSTQSGQRVSRLQVERDQAAAIRATLESLAQSKEGLSDEGAMELGAWSVNWEEIALGKSQYAAAKPLDGEKWRVMRVACGRGGARAGNAVLYDVLFVDQGSGWFAQAWEIAGGAEPRK